MKITPTSLTVAQLLVSQNEQYVIPAYQRRYSWARHQVEDLWEDLQMLEGGDSHLFGTIVCLANHHTAGINRLELVDGQQRLTTISILLHCLLARLKAENEQSEAEALARLLEAKALAGQPQPKILLDSLDAVQFKQHASGNLSEPVNNERLLQSFCTLREHLASLPLSRVGELHYRLMNQAVLIRLDVSEAKDAFKLFETINNRGLRLSPTDIIKNFVLGNAARFGEGSLELARQKWAELLRELDGIALDTFFRQHMTARQRRRVTKSEVVDEFQKSFIREVVEASTLPERAYFSIEDEEGDDDEGDVVEQGGDRDNGEEEDTEHSPALERVPFQDYISELVRRARIYRQLVLAKTGNPALDRRLRNLRLIRAQPSYGFLMSLRAGGCPDKAFADVLRLTEIFMLRRHTTRERTGENEQVFAQLCGANPTDPLEETREVLREYCPSDERFRQQFVATTFPSRLMDRARYCLEQFELELQGAYTELLPAGPDDVHVEHIVPQKIKSKKSKSHFGDWVRYLGDDSSRKHPLYVSRIGNLTLFAGPLNIGASNNPYERKKAAYLESAFKLTKDLPGQFVDFRFSEIDTRSEALADRALKIWPSI
jgi:hypothetical protein